MQKNFGIMNSVLKMYIPCMNYDQSLKVRNVTAQNSSPPLHSTLNSLPIKALTTCMLYHVSQK